MFQVAKTIADVRRALSKMKAGGATIGLVPTMGALHRGHTSLMDRARAECECVAVSIFVNPIQFNNREDYEKYQQNLPADLTACEQHGVDVVFAPPVEEMYPEPQATFVEVPDVSRGLCGEFRPGHFRGVATVVTKLFNILQPDIAYFGQKDAQQLAVIRKMVGELNFPIEIRGVPTVREADGLAMSSRNVRLRAAERAIATVVYRALTAAREAVEVGVRDTASVREAGLDVLATEPQVRMEYFEVVDAGTMQPVSEIVRPVCIATAVWIGSVRLIDNVLVEAIPAVHAA